MVPGVDKWISRGMLAAPGRSSSRRTPLDRKTEPRNARRTRRERKLYLSTPGSSGSMARALPIEYPEAF